MPIDSCKGSYKSDDYLHSKFTDSYTPNALKTPFLDLAGLGHAGSILTGATANVCTVDIEVKEAIKGPVMFYIQYENFFLNHRSVA